MQGFLIVALAIALVTVVFSLQNTSYVVVNFLFWKVQGSLALVLLVTFTLGAAASFLLSLPYRVRTGRTIARQNKTIQELQDNLVEYKKLLTPAEPVS
jgi:uncharacterized integral membrane protein